MGWAFAVAVRRLGGRWCERGPYQPCGHVGLRDPAQISLGEGLALLGRPDLGCFVGAALVYLVYHDAIDAYDLAAHTPKSSGQALASYSIFATVPAPYFNGSIVGPLIDQISAPGSCCCSWSSSSTCGTRRSRTAAR